MDELTSIEETGILDTRNVIRVETALSRFPIHRLSKLGIVDIDLHNQAGAVHWEVSHNSRYGQPGPLAYKLDTLVINRRIDELGKPVPEIIKLGSLRDIAEQLNCGKDTSLIKRALRQNAFVGIAAKITYRNADGGESWIEEDFTRYSIIFTGEQLPNGRKADAVYLRLHPTYRHILNSALTRPLDYDYMTVLVPSAQRLYEIVSYQIHYAVKQGAMYAKLRYSTYCLLAPAPRYDSFEQVKKQMYKVHRPHLDSGYLKSITFEATSDETGKADWLMLYKPGPNADRWYREFLPGTTRAVRRPRLERPENDGLTLPFPDFLSMPMGAPIPVMPAVTSQPPPNTPVPSSPADPPEVVALMEALREEGMNASDAERLAREKPDECRRQLAYLPYIEKARSKGAFLRSAIEKGFGPPPAYVEAQEEAEAEQQRDAQVAPRQAKGAALVAERAATARHMDDFISELEKAAPEAHREFLAYVEEERRRVAVRFAAMPEKNRTRMVASLIDTPGKRRELYALWQAEQARRTTKSGLRLPASAVEIERRHIDSAVFSQISSECEAYNPQLTAYGLLTTWIEHIRREGQKVADPDTSFADFALGKIYMVDQ